MKDLFIKNLIFGEENKAFLNWLYGMIGCTEWGVERKTALISQQNQEVIKKFVQNFGFNCIATGDQI